MCKVSWLPSLIPFSGEWESYLEKIYGIFKQDFVDDPPEFNGKRGGMKKHPFFRGKEATFWHLISEGNIEKEREPDFRRCERIGWPRAIIETGHLHGVKVWENKRGSKRRTILSLPDFSYVVVLEVRRDYYLLWTAYPVCREHRKRKFEKEYEKCSKSRYR
jgi:hypothetical protein